VPVELAVVVGLYNALPDIPMYFHCAFLTVRNRKLTIDWYYYHKFHRDLAWLFPAHVALDTISHGKGKRWWRWDEKLHYEIIGWLILAVIYLMSY